jgi:hypothetical protein
VNQLQRIFEKATSDFYQPANLIGWVIAKKLRTQGVKLSEAERKRVGRLAYKNIRASKKKFDLGVERRGKSPKLTLGPKDFEFINEPLDKTFEEVIPNIGKDMARRVFSEIKRESAITLAGERFLLDQFAARLYKRWRKALDSLHLFIAIAREIGATAYEHLKRLEFADKKFLIASLSRLHARACQVAGEIDSLLRAGYADGAHARWRTLHEISIVAWLLNNHGEELAERYWLHVHVEALRAANQLNKHAAKLGERRFAKRELNSMQVTVDRLCQRFGESYKNSHGWACPLFASNSNPNFSQLEELADFGHFRPYYKMASHNVHADPRGATFRIGLLPNRDGKAILAGPSNAGLDEVGGWTAYSLLNTTYSLTSVTNTLDSIVYGQILIMLKEEVVRNFWSAAAKLMADDASIVDRERQRRKKRQRG